MRGSNSCKARSLLLPDVFVCGSAEPSPSLLTMQRQTLNTALLDEASAPRSSAAFSRKSAAPSDSGGSVGGNFVIRWLSALFPDRRSRYIAVLVFALALSVSLYWLIWTIQRKWINEPIIQSISYEHVGSLPAMFGFMFSYSVPADYTYARKVIPLIQQSNSGPTLATNYINCNETFLLAWSAMCQPLDPNTGLPIFSAAAAPPGELDGSSAHHMDLSRFPLQFFDQFNDKDVCFQLHLVQNQTFATEFTEVYDNLSVPPPRSSGMKATAHGTLGSIACLIALTSSLCLFVSLLPFSNLVGLSAGATLSALELIAAGHTAPQDPVVYRIATQDGTARLGAYGYNRLLELSFSATRSVDVNGQSSIDYSYDVVTNLPRSPAQTARDFQQLLDSSTPVEVARLQQLMLLPSTSYQSTRLCVEPRSFQVQVIRSLRLYSFASFLTDLGGAVNFISLSLLILFPLSASITRPRSFLPLWIMARWQRRNQAAHSMEAAEAEMAGGLDGSGGVSSSSSFSLEPSASFGNQQGVPLTSPRGYMQQSG